MLKVYSASNQADLQRFISNTMTKWNADLKNGWAFEQPDCSKTAFPAQFVIVADHKLRLATIQILH